MAGTGAILCVINVAILAILVGRFVFLNDDQTEDLPVTKFEESYDYIVVGSGSAGSVVAARLSEDRDVTVLVLEAGPDDRGNIHLTIPSDAAGFQHTKLDWEYYTEPQQYRVYVPRGRVVGGSSQLNFMVHVRGNRFDFDKWAANGCDGWSYEDVLPYFKKYEDMADEELAKSGIRLLQKLLKTDVLKNIGARLHSTPMPQCTQHQYDSDEYWQCYVRVLTICAFHQCCTCKMGALNDPTAVVDPQLRVKGIDGLRVADASIMPLIVSANTNAASIMIGEKAADIIKGNK
ncbi:glucose dehydrogenase [FAD, quinone]-like [Gigantopelta aegis]|uniref:glucose dehydrogenase [FAD, quinone]-like n=1 Tax=Gigantopelta aegis TaxID=1735272 RepID=UPI001B88D583|nr:glucose dehydrogenase [FAD, quinone]-like [Gigantopelta aegis]